MLLKREPYKAIFKVLTWIGFWDEISMRHKLLTFYLPIFILTIEQILLFLSLLQANNLEDILEAVKLVPMFPLICYSMYSFIKDKQLLKELIEIFNQIENENPKVVSYIDKSCKDVELIFKIVTFAFVLIVVDAIFTPLINNKLLFPIYTPKWKGFETTFFYLYWLLESFCGIYVALCFIVIQEFRNSLLIILHYIMEYFQVSDDIQNISVLMFLLLALLFLMYMICYRGNDIEEKSKQLMNDLFSCEWYQAELKIQKIIIILMENFKKPMILKAFGFNAINLEFFLQVLKIAYSMYAVLKHLH
ncbi:hypothetical protein PVAND_008019 [Polypedilum vanderplanki]|uniref:Odorant receptor n=1 Tax=Polypedilum vanderplanki TaxID=319348 RepID=A0A9J6C9M2_POLVA|nr:hypothetical protein PVAND_008019 [Polypedilum vanderplanki]